MICISWISSNLSHVVPMSLLVCVLPILDLLLLNLKLRNLSGKELYGCSPMSACCMSGENTMSPWHLLANLDDYLLMGGRAELRADKGRRWVNPREALSPFLVRALEPTYWLSNHSAKNGMLTQAPFKSQISFPIFPPRQVFPIDSHPFLSSLNGWSERNTAPASPICLQRSQEELTPPLQLRSPFEGLLPHLLLLQSPQLRGGY